MVDGGVSIAVRSVYPGKQARILSYELLQEAIKAAGKEMRRAQRFAAVSSNRTIANRANDANSRSFKGGGIMSRAISCLIILLFSLSLVVSSAMAQVEMSTQTIRGDLLSIKGDLYVIKDIFGRLVYLHVDKNTKRERLLVPGERIEADVIIGERVVALRPSK